MAWFHNRTLPPFLEKKPFWRYARVIQNGYMPPGFVGRDLWVLNMPPLIETEGHDPFRAQDAFEREATDPAKVYITNLEDTLCAKRRLMENMAAAADPRKIPWQRPQTIKSHIANCVHIDESAIQLLHDFRWKPWEVPWVWAQEWMKVGAESLPRQFGPNFKPNGPLLRGL